MGERPERKVGTRVTTSGYPGTITRVCEWSDALVEVRLASGTVCVDIADCERDDSRPVQDAGDRVLYRILTGEGSAE